MNVIIKPQQKSLEQLDSFAKSNVFILGDESVKSKYGFSYSCLDYTKLISSSTPPAYLVIAFKEFTIGDTSLTFDACETFFYIWCRDGIKKVPQRTSPEASSQVRAAK
jgi:hypothetical protein